MQPPVKQGIGQQEPATLVISDININKTPERLAKVGNHPLHLLGAVKAQTIIVHCGFDCRVRLTALPGPQNDPIVESITHNLYQISYSFLRNTDHGRIDKGDLKDVNVGKGAQHDVRKAVFVNYLNCCRSRIVWYRACFDSIECITRLRCWYDIVDHQALTAQIKLRVFTEIRASHNNRCVAVNASRGWLDPLDIGRWFTACNRG